MSLCKSNIISYNRQKQHISKSKVKDIINYYYLCYNISDVTFFKGFQCLYSGSCNHYAELLLENPFLKHHILNLQCQYCILYKTKLFVFCK